MTLDVEAIGRDKSNLVELPDPTLQSELTFELASLFTTPMTFPSDRGEQVLFAAGDIEVYERFGDSGTLVYMPNCDRLTYAKPKTLVEHAMKEMARIYRRQIAQGLKLYINNRLVEAFDPTYSMLDARHVRFLDCDPKQSRLVLTKIVKVRVSEKSNETAPVEIKMYKLPIESWSYSSTQDLKK